MTAWSFFQVINKIRSRCSGPRGKQESCCSLRQRGHSLKRINLHFASRQDLGLIYHVIPSFGKRTFTQDDVIGSCPGLASTSSMGSWELSFVVAKIGDLQGGLRAATHDESSNAELKLDWTSVGTYLDPICPIHAQRRSHPSGSRVSSSRPVCIIVQDPNSKAQRSSIASSLKWVCAQIPRRAKD